MLTGVKKFSDNITLPKILLTLSSSIATFWIIDNYINVMNKMEMTNPELILISSLLAISSPILRSFQKYDKKLYQKSGHYVEYPNRITNWDYNDNINH